MITSTISVAAFYMARGILCVLMILSVLSIAFFIDRLLYFRRHFLKTDSLLPKLERADTLEEVSQVLSQYPASESRVILKGLNRPHLDGAGFARHVAAYFQPEKQVWERYTGFLGSVGSNAPFIGLLGTVLGILKSFADLGTAATKGPQVVMTGISEALIVTAVGLAVAIPAVVFYNILKTRIKAGAVRVESICNLISAKPIFKGDHS